MRTRFLRIAEWTAFSLVVLAWSWASITEAGEQEKTQPGAAIAPDQLAFFEQKIRPVLVESCYGCHSESATKLKGGLRLDMRDGWARGGDSGQPAIVAGEPDESPLILAVRREDGQAAMPPKDALSATQVADLVAWVKMGAPDPRTGASLEAKRADKSWWSLQPLRAVEPPTPSGIPDAWTKNPIDRFVFAGLAAKSLAPSPPADPHTLIRRATYDLTGLPPSSEEVETFASDFARNPDAAWEALVDRLLASPHYGEHWGRHWLDVVRFGESTGFEQNTIWDNAWPFRDYVIRSLNDDKPLNRLITEHLAGDVVGKDDPDSEIGVAFLTLGPYDAVTNQDPIAAAQIRAATLDEIVTATSSAFLGVTVNCARCHNHKFDPVPTEDYYRMKAAFEGVFQGSRVLATKPDRERYAAAMGPLEARKKELIDEKDALIRAIVARADKAAPSETTRRPAPRPQWTEETFAPVEARHVRLRILGTSSSARSGVGARLDEFEVWTAGEAPRNAALAATGATADGAAYKPEDFGDAYGPNLVNDGEYGARWFVGNPAELTIHLAQTERIERVVFSNTRGERDGPPVAPQGPFVVEYEILASADGQNWTRVADSFDREPTTPELASERKIRAFQSDEDRQHRDEIDRELADVQTRIKQVPALPSVWVGTFSQPTERTVVFKGGDPQKKGDAVCPSSLSVLDHSAPAYELPGDAPEADRRLALAKWITSDENPLTARVLANRVWHYHFGTGIVDTPSDFGFLGSRPTHPELLDWLALRLQHHGWRLKPLHREILLSQTYRQAGTWRDDAAQLDKDARFLWRFPPRRLDAEEIRDTMLAVAGQLDLRAGGPGFRLYHYAQDNVSTYFPLDQPGPETYRRAVYHQNARASVVDILSDFDQPDSAFSAPKRSRTTTPLQALTLLNHNFTLDMARALAERVERKVTDPSAQADRLFSLAFQRTPTPTERNAATALIQKHGLQALARVILNTNELIYVD